MAGSAHYISCRKAPAIWQEGFPLGNGELGAMVWGDGNPFIFTLDRADLWDLRNDPSFMDSPDYNYAALRRLVSEERFNEVDEIFEQRQLRDNPVGPTKISIGRAELRIGAEEVLVYALDVDRALVEGVVKTSSGEHEFTCFVHKAINALCVRVENAPAGAELRVVPLAEMSEPLAKLQHPVPVITEEGNLRMLVQEIPDGPAYCLIWNTCGPEFILVAESGRTVQIAVEKARGTWHLAFEMGFDRLVETHADEWSKFWRQSSVYLPEPDLELLWYYGIYLLASSAKRGALPPGLQGLWAMDGIMPPWRGDYHADMNVQEMFWPACASGHLDLLDSWCDYMKSCMEPAREFTDKFFGTEGTFWAACTIPSYTIVSCWHTVQFCWSHTGWLGWLVWLRWRYSMDVAWLAEVGYPVIAGIFRFYQANLEMESDGFLHVPLSSSPEYKENTPKAWCKDPNIDLALIKRCCDWIVEIEGALEISDLSDSAKNVRERLAPYSLTEDKILCLWPGKVLDESHRHPSQLMAIHPAMDLTIDGDEETQTIISASLEQFLALGQYRWAGHTYAQMISFASVLGRVGLAYDCLRQFYSHWIGKNGLHFNKDLTNSGMSYFRIADSGMNGAPFTMEASNAVAAGISDMLVQGWGDIVRVFPAVPDHWRDVAFRDLRTEGAFELSASMKDGKTVWVRVCARTDRVLRLQNPFGNADVACDGVRREGDMFVADMKSGQEIVLALPGQTVDMERAVSAVRQNNISRLGLR